MAEAALLLSSRNPEDGYSFDIQIQANYLYASPRAAAKGQPRGMAISPFCRQAAKPWLPEASFI